jgi:hypothetical protein
MPLPAPHLTSRGITLWMVSVTVCLGIMLKNQDLIGTHIYRFGPNEDLYILGFCIDTVEKYSAIAIFCCLNSGVRTLNHVIMQPWITNQVQDISKPIEVSTFAAYEISCVSCAYIWFDFFMYMNILLTQIDMMLIEVGSDLIMTAILTSYYLKENPFASLRFPLDPSLT